MVFLSKDAFTTLKQIFNRSIIIRNSSGFLCACYALRLLVFYILGLNLCWYFNLDFNITLLFCIYKFSFSLMLVYLTTSYR